MMAFSREPRASSSKSTDSSTSAVSSPTSDPTTTTSEESEPEPAPGAGAILYRDPHETKGHSTALDLSNFAILPYDVRAMIWRATFVSRQISLVCETVRLTPSFDPPFKRTTPPNPSLEYNNHMEYTSFLTCPKINSPAALSANRESRHIALLSYRPWRMFNKELLYRDIMWCPDLDVVDLLQAVKVPLDEHVPFVKALPLIEKQFPNELVEIKNLAVPSTLWGEGQHKNIDVIWPLIDFLSLKELVVVLDKIKEREHAYNHKRGLSSVALDLVAAGVEMNWTIPEDITKHMDVMRGHYEKLFGPQYIPLRKKPVVTIVEKEDQIHGNQDLHVVIRCRPCPYLGVAGPTT